ncbi:1689_t:CDS:2 [Rhizophagus irregularis]|nr:1689_t:CDS:2 [Rhizophagus irregularis]
MAKEMQNSIRYSTVLTIFEIPDHVEIGKLIGRKGRNLKPIEKGTDKLLEDIKIRNQRKDNEKEEENVKIADSDTNHQDATVTTITTVATPKNHKDNDLKEKIKRFKQKNIPYDQNTTNKIFQECMDLLIFYLIICLSNIRFYIFSKEDAKRNSPINRMN